MLSGKSITVTVHSMYYIYATMKHNVNIAWVLFF